VSTSWGRAARVNEHLEGGSVFERIVGLDAESLGRPHGAAVSGEAPDGEAVAGEVARPEGQHLPRPDRVELLDVGEEENPNVLRLVGRRRHASDSSRAVVADEDHLTPAILPFG